MRGSSMRYPFLVHVVVSLLIIILPGCCLYVDWGKRNFYQGNKVYDRADCVRGHIRSVSIYNQFSTCALFDALWLSDKVRTTYAHVYAQRLGLDEKRLKIFLDAQLDENRNRITFFVLSLYDILLDSPTSAWSIILNTDNKRFVPLSIKSVELAPEYRVFLSCELSRFKTAYEVVFDAFGADGLPILNSDTGEMILEFRSVKKSASLSWCIDDGLNMVTRKSVSGDKPFSLRNGPTRCQNELGSCV